MNDDMGGAIIGAASAFGGVLIGTVFMPWIREHATRRRAARYLAIRVVCVLDEFIDSCISVALDSGSENRDGLLEPRVAERPMPRYPHDLDWRSIPHDLMYDLLSFPNAAKKVADAVQWASGTDDPPDFPEFFEIRSIQYSNLGLRAHALAARLRIGYRIAAPVAPAGDPDWDPIGILRRVAKETEERRLARIDSLTVD